MLIRNLLILVLAAAVFWLAAERFLLNQDRQAVAVVSPTPTLEPIVPPAEGIDSGRYVADINVHTVEELQTLFGRIEQLLQRPRGADEAPLISVVLHGPEVEFFALNNYAEHKAVVDQAARLSALGAVDVSICQSQMRARGIDPDQVPAFLDQVPYGPGEVERLVGDGYVLM